MGLRIGTNVASVSAQNRLSAVNERLNKSFLRLATGRRVTSAADDAAGVAISARLTRQVRSLDQAVRNSSDGIAMVAAAEGSLAEANNVLQRMRELGVQAQNGTLTSTQRASLNSEFTQLSNQLDSIATGTTFNGTSLLSGTSTITLQVGPDTGTSQQLTFATVDVQVSALSVSGGAVDTIANASTAVANIDTDIDTIANARGTFGSVQAGLEASISSLTARSEALSAANSRIIDVDVAKETAELTRNSILQQSALAVLVQANNQPTAALALLG